MFVRPCNLVPAHTDVEAPACDTQTALPLLADPEIAARFSDPAAILAALMATVSQRERRGDDEIRALDERRQESEEAQQLDAMRSEASHGFRAALIGGSFEAVGGTLQGVAATLKPGAAQQGMMGVGKALEGSKTLATMSLNESVKQDQVLAKQHDQGAQHARRSADDASAAAKEDRDAASRALDQVKAFLEAAHQARMAPLQRG